MKKRALILVCTLALLLSIGVFASTKETTIKTDLKNHEIKSLLDSMTLEEKLSQMIIVDIPYIFDNHKQEDFTRVNESVEVFLRTRKPGGIILFENNMKTTEQTKELISNIKKIKSKAPLFISVDQEGGRVDKIPIKLNVPTAKSIGMTGNPRKAYEAGKKIGNALKELGFNLNYAPDMDVNTNPKNPIIGDRSFGSDVKKVSIFGVEFIRGLRKEGILSTAKHFPGHGDTIGDSHKGFVEVPHDIKRINKIELAPFTAAIRSNVDFIMVGHIAMPALDDSKMPASLSKPIVTDLLKGKMGFKGVVITDALDMGAITQKYNKFEAVKLAINSGCDIALMPDITIIPGKDVSEYDDLIAYLRVEVEYGNIEEERINDAVMRILEAKAKIK